MTVRVKYTIEVEVADPWKPLGFHPRVRAVIYWDCDWCDRWETHNATRADAELMNAIRNR